MVVMSFALMVSLHQQAPVKHLHNMDCFKFSILRHTCMIILYYVSSMLEITSLPQGDTVCSYCGVSYLIHHEIKRLEQELKESLEGFVIWCT